MRLLHTVHIEYCKESVFFWPKKPGFLRQIDGKTQMHTLFFFCQKFRENEILTR